MHEDEDKKHERLLIAAILAAGMTQDYRKSYSPEATKANIARDALELADELINKAGL